MVAQHKRPGRNAKIERQHRAWEREKRHKEQLARRAKIMVHFPRKWDPESVDEFRPGKCVAWANGEYEVLYENK